MKFDLSEIPIKSAIKVFEFINSLLEEESLNPDYFRNKITEFSIGEKYFIYLYTSKYLKIHTLEEKKHKNYKESFLELWINDIELQYSTDDISDYVSKIVKNASKILRITNETTIKCLKTELKHNKDLENKTFKNPFSAEKPLPFFDFENNDYKTYKKIPLNVDTKHKEKFKSQFIEILTRCMDYKSVKQFYNNSFEGSNSATELNLLYIHIESKSLLDSCIREIVKSYKENISDHLKEKGYYDRINNSIDKRLSESTLIRQKFLPKKLKYQKITRYHFMIAMYNAFPHIREGYKNQSKSVEDFLKQRMKNF